MKNTLFYEDIKNAEERGKKIADEQNRFDFRIKTIKKFLGRIPNSELAEFLEFSEEELESFIKENNISSSI